MEQFDLVNQHDQIIGITDKKTAHQRGDIHRVACVYVFTPDNKLYVQEHIKSRNKWDHSVGGHVSKGETYEEAAKREAVEEINITDALELVSIIYSDERYPWNTTRIKHMFGIFECRPSPSWHFSPNAEVKHIFPMAIEDIVKRMNEKPETFTGGFINSMREYIKQKQLPYHLKRYQTVNR